MIKKEFLQSHALFGGVGDEDMEMIMSMLKEEHFPPGVFIIREGEEGDTLHFICSGSVEVLKEVAGPDGPVQERLAVLSSGDAFGEMELIDIQKRSASVRTLEEVSALTLSNRDVYQIYCRNIKAYTIIIMNLARELSRRLRKMDILLSQALYIGKK